MCLTCFSKLGVNARIRRERGCSDPGHRVEGSGRKSPHLLHHVGSPAAQRSKRELLRASMSPSMARTKTHHPHVPRTIRSSLLTRVSSSIVGSTIPSHESLETMAPSVSLQSLSSLSTLPQIAQTQEPWLYGQRRPHDLNNARFPRAGSCARTNLASLPPFPSSSLTGRAPTAPLLQPRPPQCRWHHANCQPLDGATLGNRCADFCQAGAPLRGKA